ncbi:MAG: regulatory protein GemA [Desulfobulbaceae bacterium]|nr:regulatory protein GemA [Desulfobulbaceae bacterium]
MPNRGSLAKIHIAKKDLGLSEEEYRDILQNRFGKQSSADLSQPQADQLIRHFQSLGWKPKQKSLPGFGGSLASDPMSRKIRALWLELANGGVVRNRSEKALLTFVKGQVKVERLEWASTAQKAQIIEALKDWGKREGVNLV